MARRATSLPRDSYISAGEQLNRAVREGCAAKGCRQKLYRACRKAPAHGLGSTCGSGKGILTAGSMSSALQQQLQLSLSLDTRSPRAFRGAWLLLTEGRHSPMLAIDYDFPCIWATFCIVPSHQHALAAAAAPYMDRRHSILLSCWSSTSPSNFPLCTHLGCEVDTGSTVQQ